MRACWIGAFGDDDCVGDGRQALADTVDAVILRGVFGQFAFFSDLRGDLGALLAFRLRLVLVFDGQRRQPGVRRRRPGRQNQQAEHEKEPSHSPRFHCQSPFAATSATGVRCVIIDRDFTEMFQGDFAPGDARLLCRAVGRSAVRA